MANNSDVFSKISTQRKSHLIEEQIKASISEGHFSLDEKLPSERELAKSFGASRTIVREAIRSLENAGLLIVKTGIQGGSFVNKVGKKPFLESVRNMILTNQISHKEIAEARLLIEPSLAAEAAEKATPDDLKQLKESISVLKKHFQSNDGYSPVEYKEPNLHKVIAGITGNRMIITLMDVLMEIAGKRFSAIKLDKTNQEIVISEHEKIIEAVETKDPSKAAERMKNHILEVYLSHEALEKRSDQ